MKLTAWLASTVLAIAPGAPALGQSLAPDIAIVTIVNAPIAEVWKAWTTAEGIESSFAAKAPRVEPWPGGVFELWFGVDYPEGSRGSEGCRVHSVTPMEQFVFESNAPPTIPEIRPLRALVYHDARRTEVTLHNFGDGQGEAWDRSRAYFTRAGNAVMASLAKRFAAAS